ncbi:CHAT domain-containing protein [Desulfococcaceae bacterium HSG9]|nr:CHAT domain-containing protein [Desulfococcaceae bacterium HSG9]
MERTKKQILAIFLFILLVTALFNVEKTLAQTDNVTDNIAGLATAAPQQLIIKAEEFYAQGDFEKAAHFLEQSLALSDPEKPENDVGVHLDATMFLSEVYLDLGYHQRALEILESVIPLIIAGNDRFRNVLFLNSLSDVHFTLGNMVQMAKYLIKAVEEARLTQNPRILARVLNNLGNAFAVDRNFQEALAAYGESLELIANTSEDLNLKSAILVNIARASYFDHYYENAVTGLEYALQEIDKLPDSHDKAADMIALSLMAMEIRNDLLQSPQNIDTESDLTFKVNPTTVKLTENAYNVLVNIPQGFTLQKHEKYKYTIYFDFGQIRFSGNQVIVLQNKLTEIIRNEETVYAYIRLKGFTDSIGMRKDAKENKKGNLKLSIKRIEVVNAYLTSRLLPGRKQTDNKGDVWIYSLLMGEFTNTNDAMAKASELEKQYQIPTFLEKKVYKNAQIYFLYAGEFRSAEEAAAKSMQLFNTAYPADPISFAGISEITNKNGKLLISKEAKGNLASAVTDIYHHRGQAKDRKVEVEMTVLTLVPIKKAVSAETAFSENRKVFVSNTPIDAFKIGAVYLKDLMLIANYTMNTAKRIGELLQDKRILAQTHGQIGARLKNEKHFSKAIQKAEQALFFAQKQNRPYMIYLRQWQMAKLFKAQGDMTDAIKYYEKAVKTLKPIHQKLLRGYRSQKNPFDTEIRPVYLELAEIYLDQADAMPDAHSRELKLRQARDIMEMLKAFELQDFFQDGCLIKETEKVTSDRAAPHTAVIYPIILPDRLALLLILPDGIKQIKTTVDSKTLKQTVMRFRRRLQTRTNNRFLYEARQLYDWIIRPMEDMLADQKVNTLIIAPDSTLRLIPFSTFHDGKQFLVEKYALATVPAITLTKPERLVKNDEQILISGLSEAVQGFSALPGVTAELHDIKEIMNGKVLLQNSEHTIDNLFRELKNNPYSIVHLATHGVFGGTPDETFLLTYDGKLNMNRLAELLGLRKYRNDKVELLVMSACQTALGDERAALGLSGIAVKAGVRSVIATLWFVDDEATSLAIRELYRQLTTPGIYRAKALQNAQKKLISQARYWHPLYWAPFLLIGNWM